MVRLLVNIDELVALVRARAILAEEGLPECADALGEILRDSALDVSSCD
jgi:hypothetical protein